MAMPMDAVFSTCSPNTMSGAPIASRVRWASWSMADWSASPGRRMANSSPPTRATVSWLRTVSTRRSPTCRIRSSPAPWPSVSFTSLKWSRSTKNMQTGSPTPRGPDRSPSAPPHLSDQVVPGPVAQRVVHLLEVVEVDEEHADRLADPSGPDQFLLDPILEQAAIGQSGQGIVPRHVGDPFEHLEVLEGSGGQVGQAGQPLVEVRVVDGPSRADRTEVGGDHSEELAGGAERGHHR